MKNTADSDPKTKTSHKEKQRGSFKKRMVLTILFSLPVICVLALIVISHHSYNVLYIKAATSIVETVTKDNRFISEYKTYEPETETYLQQSFRIEGRKDLTGLYPDSYASQDFYIINDKHTKPNGDKNWNAEIVVISSARTPFAIAKTVRNTFCHYKSYLCDEKEIAQFKMLAHANTQTGEFIVGPIYSWYGTLPFFGTVETAQKNIHKHLTKAGFDARNSLK